MRWALPPVCTLPISILHSECTFLAFAHANIYITHKTASSWALSSSTSVAACQRVICLVHACFDYCRAPQCKASNSATLLDSAFPYACMHASMYVQQCGTGHHSIKHTPHTCAPWHRASGTGHHSTKHIHAGA